MFAEKGYTAVKTEDIAGESGISKATLYSNFPSKLELIKEIVKLEHDRITEKINSIVDEMYSGEIDFLEGLNAVLSKKSKAASSFFTETLIESLRIKAPEVWDFMKRMRDKEIKNTYGRMYQIGVKHGIFKNEISFDFSYEVFISLIEHMLTPKVLSQMSLSWKEAMGLLHQIFLTGVLTSKAQEKYNKLIHK